MLNNTIGEKLEQIRFEKHLNKQEFTKEIGISGQSYRDYLCGKMNPSFIVMKTIAEKFNVNLNWLINGKGKKFIEIEQDRELEIELQLRKRIDELQNELLNGFRNNKKD